MKFVLKNSLFDPKTGYNIPAGTEIQEDQISVVYSPGLLSLIDDDGNETDYELPESDQQINPDQEPEPEQQPEPEPVESIKPVSRLNKLQKEKTGG